jgi:hypothetical protein
MLTPQDYPEALDSPVAIASLANDAGRSSVAVTNRSGFVEILYNALSLSLSLSLPTV